MYAIGIPMGIILNLLINFSNILMFITLFLMIYEHRNVLKAHCIFFNLPDHQHFAV